MSLRDSMILNEPTVGVIIPPPEIKRVIDQAAELIIKYGSNITAMMQKESENMPKFSFLKEGDPFRPYYLHKVEELAKINNHKQQVNNTDNINNTDSSTITVDGNKHTSFLGKKTQSVNSNTKNESIISEKRKKQQEQIRIKLLNLKKIESDLEQIKPPTIDQFSLHHPNNINSLDT